MNKEINSIKKSIEMKEDVEMKEINESNENKTKETKNIGGYNDESNKIGKGTFAEVFQGYVSVDGVIKIAAAKKITFPKIPSEYQINYPLIKKIKQDYDKQSLGSYEFEYQKKQIEIQKLKRIKEKLYYSFCNETIALSICDGHPNIISYYGFIFNDNKVFIYTEYCNYGTLKTAINNIYGLTGKKRTITSLLSEKHLETLSKYFMKQLKNAMLWLRQNKIMHRDLKPENILLTSSFDCSNINRNNNVENISNNGDRIFNELIMCTIKLADFGLSTVYEDNQTFNSRVGSLPFMAPEIIYGENYDYKVDVWSFGIVLFKILIGKLPFPYKTFPEMKKWITDVKISDFNKPCRDFVKGCLTFDKKDRFTWEEIDNHEWFSSHDLYGRNSCINC